MKNNFLTFLTLFTVLFLVTSCNEDDPTSVNEEENITKIVLNITETGTTNSTDYIWQENGLLPSINLSANKSYTSTLTFYNGTESLNSEIINEKDDHFVVYTTSLSGITITRSANDAVRSDGNKLGLNAVITTSATLSNGELSVRLVHLPTSVSDANGFGTVQGGETDADVSFIASVQ